MNNEEYTRNIETQKNMNKSCITEREELGLMDGITVFLLPRLTQSGLFQNLETLNSEIATWISIKEEVELLDGWAWSGKILTTELDGKVQLVAHLHTQTHTLTHFPKEPEVVSPRA